MQLRCHSTVHDEVIKAKMRPNADLACVLMIVDLIFTTLTWSAKIAIVRRIPL